MLDTTENRIFSDAVQGHVKTEPCCAATELLVSVKRYCNFDNRIAVDNERATFEKCLSSISRNSTVNLRNRVTLWMPELDGWKAYYSGASCEQMVQL